jgi:hypothetical protein
MKIKRKPFTSALQVTNWRSKNIPSEVVFSRTLHSTAGKNIIFFPERKIKSKNPFPALIALSYSNHLQVVSGDLVLDPVGFTSTSTLRKENQEQNPKITLTTQKLAIQSTTEPTFSVIYLL